MKARRAPGMETSPARGPRRETKPHGEAVESMLPRKTSREASGARTKTDTGRRVEYTKAIGRTTVKELGIIVP